MYDPKVAVIGAGAMGGTMAAALARGGARVSIIDTDTAHVRAIDANGLQVDGFDGAVRLPASERVSASAFADLVLVMTPAYETGQAAVTAAEVLKPDGAALSMQNGLGNAEALIARLGQARVFMGSTRASADRPAPGCPRITKMDPSTVGELNGTTSERTTWVAETLTKGGMPTEVTSNIQGVLWSKFIHNCCINAPSAVTGLRMGEVSRVPGLAELRWQIAEEALAVARAKGITLEYPDPVPMMQVHVWRKFTKPSMQQHVDQGRQIEIDAINGYLVQEAEALGLDAPLNRVITALARGRALAAQRVADPPEYHRLAEEAEAEIARGERPWETD